MITIDRLSFGHLAAQLQHPTLPRELVDLADVATNGECFWPPDGAAEAARVLAAQGFVIIGGEVYCRQSVGWAAYLGQWESSPSERDDAAERIEAGLTQALDAIEAGPAAWGEPEGSWGNLRFFIAVASTPLVMYGQMFYGGSR